MGKKFMRSAHDSKVVGHFGINSMMELISWNFCSPTMKDDVR
jgi:hypothetical protein